MAASPGMAQCAEDIFRRASGATPLWSFRSPAEDGMSVARWRFPRLAAIETSLPCAVLAYRAGGSAWATSITRGRAVRKRPRIGSVSFVRDHGHSPWSVDGPFDVVHVYLQPGSVARVAERQLDAPVREIDEFFAVEDPWLAGYFRMVISEFDAPDAREGKADTMLLEESEHLLVRHLLRRHAGGTEAVPVAGRARTTNPLRPTLLRRAEDYVRANLAGDISLHALAGVCCMSVDHFLRSFRAASGLTPHQYVLEQRLLRAAERLRTSETPIAGIAAACGFGNASHFSVQFHARFGMSPSGYRRRA